MKKIIYQAFLLLLLCSGVSYGAISYAAALKKAGGKKPVVLFCYGANYDKVSEARYDEFIKKRGLSRALRGVDVVEVPIYQFPDDRQKKEFERVMEGRSLPGGIWSYPCLAVVDSQGNLRGVVQSADEMKDLASASAALSDLITQFYEQEKVLEKAVRASGAARRALLAEAANYDLAVPLSALKSEDSDKKGEAKDAQDELKKLKFDPLVLVEKIQTMSIEQAYNYIREMEDAGGRSKYQRQEMLAALTGHVRRNHGSPQLLKALYIEMRNIDPTSSYGAYAEGALEMWCGMGDEEKSGK